MRAPRIPALTPEKIAQIAKPIRRFGFINPILVDDANFMIAGHGRLEGAKAVGLDQVPTVRARARYVLTSSQITGLRKTPDGHVEVNVEFGKVLQFKTQQFAVQLREKYINVVDVKPDRDKRSRLISQIDLFEDGSVLLPKDAPWLDAFVSELLSFPGRHDDQVDALTQGLAWHREVWKSPLVQRTTRGI